MSIDHIADQPWSNGKVGLTGGSYDGTIATGTAVEQPISGRHKDAVAAVIPIRAIDRWYDYHFLNGVPSSRSRGDAGGVHRGVRRPRTSRTPAPTTPSSPRTVAQRKACIATLGAVTAAGYAPTYQDADSAFWTERNFVKDAKARRPPSS